MTTQTPASTPAPKKARAAARTPQQKAQDLLDQAKARHNRAIVAQEKAAATRKDALKAFDASEAEVSAAEAAVKYAEGHPDLPKKTTAAATSGGQIAPADPSQVSS